ncbi:DUF1761 domain-containing protein [Oceanibium sediminis]|uniref:DUF1761 domain-containing protein n=1 Tax=Oceanibium sediminis TaxID=2026339 RepID=UPI000DD3D59D|nr:DUF1761 domain-containing protein [Oceanibium sediminis]
MGVIAVLLAALASFIWGGVWYGAMAKPWMAANELSEDTIDRRNPVPYVIAFIAAVLVAGMMRHILATQGADGLGAGAMTGFGLGLFIVTPWVATNYAFSGRPMNLTLIDGAYATVGCTIMGIVLSLF